MELLTDTEVKFILKKYHSEGLTGKKAREKLNLLINKMKEINLKKKRITQQVISLNRD